MAFAGPHSPHSLIPRPPLKRDATHFDSDSLKTDPTDHSTDLLPAMSTVHAPLMPRLMPITMAPTLPSRASAPLAFLETVDRIEINETVERDGVTYYVMDVFLQHHSSRIPTNKSEQTRLSNAQPDYRVEHRFNDFADLRYQVWSYAQRKHESSTSCGYCDEYMHFIVHSLSQPRLLVKIGTGVSKRKQLLATFCNEFIAMAIGAKIASRSRNFTCDGYQAIPYIIERVFRKRL
jgi:hypothetical protein